MNEPVRIGVVGLGTVGSGVMRLLSSSADHIARNAGRQIVVERAVVANPAKDRGLEFPAERISSDITTISRDPSISVGVLLVGGLEPARSMAIELLENGKDLVTANKALLAEHGPELFALARKQGRAIAFEAAVAGGIPIVAAISECLAANQIESIRGILNGTSNFILTRMEEDGIDYAEALALAQAKGFAEADPSMDVDGTDATQKLAILAHLAFGVWVPWKEIPMIGVDTLDIGLLQDAAALGYRIRLVAVATRTDGVLSMRVTPSLVRMGTPLAETRGAFNAVTIVGDAVGPMFFHGLGAGMMPTASAVVADIIDTVVGRAAITFRTTGVLSAESPDLTIGGDTQECHFLRVGVRDRPGVLASITGILGEHGISIASMLQRASSGETDEAVSLVIMTHRCSTAAIARAVAAIDSLPAAAEKSVCLPVLDQSRLDDASPAA